MQRIKHLSNQKIRLHNTTLSGSSFALLEGVSFVNPDIVLHDYQHAYDGGEEQSQARR